MPSNGNRDPDWLTAGRGHVWWPYTQMQTAPAPLPVVRTHGTRLVLADGRELIDGVASWWTACHGYNHPHIRAAIEHQLAQMPHVMFAGIAHEQPLRLAQRLAAHLPDDLDHVFYSDSGSVAVEIVVPEGDDLAAAQLRAGPDAGMGEFIHQHEIVGAGQHRNDAAVGEIAGAEHAGGIRAFQA